MSVRKPIEARAAPDATTDRVIALLPPQTRRLAERRHADGGLKESEGRSVAHLRLEVVGPAFRDAVKELRFKRLGCFCAETDPCHAKVLLEFAASRGHRTPRTQAAAPCGAAAP